MTKYVCDKQHGKVDGKTKLDPADDAAKALWGKEWRIPSSEDVIELIEKCSWSIGPQNNVMGLTAKGPNGKCIFFPATGSMMNDEIVFVGSNVRIWTSNLDNDLCGLCLDGDLDMRDVHLYNLIGRWLGMPIRPVRSK